MTAKPPRPALKVDDDDLAPPSRARLPQAPDDDDRRILAGADRLSARHGALRDGTTATAPPVVALPAPLTMPASWKLVLPEYLDREIARRAADRQVTKNFLVLEALASAGYEVRPDDLVGDRRRRRK